MSKASHDNLFATYVGLGPRRSYDRLADVTGVSRRTIADVAVREEWQSRTEQIERSIAARANDEAIESVEEMHRRHQKTLRALQAKSLESIRSERLPPTAAARALIAAIREERESRMVPSAAGVDDEAALMAERIRYFLHQANVRTMGGYEPDEESANGDRETDGLSLG